MAWPHAPWTLPLLPYVLIVCFCYVACLDSVFKFDYRMVHLVQSQREEEPSWGRHSRTQVLRVLCLRNKVWSEHTVHLGFLLHHHCDASPSSVPWYSALILYSSTPLLFNILPPPLSLVLVPREQSVLLLPLSPSYQGVCGGQWQSSNAQWHLI